MANRLFDVVAAALGVDVAVIAETTSAATLESWDSLRQMQLVFALEEAYGVTFGDDEIPTLDSVVAIRALLGAKGVTVA